METAEFGCPEEVASRLSRLRKALSLSDQRILLIAAWTTKEESRRFKVHPEVCTWDVTESTNAEHRGLFMGCNFDANMKSNVHTNVFLPSGQRWVFDWIASAAIGKLHGPKTISRVQLNVFDQAPNEFGPFMNHMINSLFRLCWFHRGIQKTAKFKCLATSEEAQQGLNNVNLLLDHLSDTVENEKEYELSLQLLYIFVEKNHSQGVFSVELFRKIIDQIAAVDNNKKYIANHYFKLITHLFKRTTTANECRHNNYKNGEDSIAPNNSLAQSASKQNMKRKDSTTKKLMTDAKNLLSSPLWAKGVEHVSPLAGRLLLKSWKSKDFYAHVRLNKSTWLVMWYKTSQIKKTIIPQYYRVRTVTLIEDKYLECDCCAMKHLGICCPHILSITNKIHESCCTVRWWNQYCFYYGRDNVDPKITEKWDLLAFSQPPYRGVRFKDQKPMSFPVMCEKTIPVQNFLKVKNALAPVILNYKTETVTAALNRIQDMSPPPGMSQECHMTPRCENAHENHAPYHFPDPDDEPCSNFVEQASLYHKMTGSVKDICKYEKNISKEMHDYLVETMEKLAEETISNIHGKFKPPELSLKPSSVHRDSEGENSQAIVSLYPELDKRSKATRIRSGYESNNLK